MHAHTFFKKGNVHADESITQAIIEYQLINEFHWLPQDIKKIPYKSLQEFLLLRRIEREAKEEENQISYAKAEAKKIIQQQKGGRR